MLDPPALAEGGNIYQDSLPGDFDDRGGLGAGLEPRGGPGFRRLDEYVQISPR